MANMRDVAERAGVSVSTVSHVINETRPVSESLRGRVLAAMTELRYQPNRLARSLRVGETQTIGLIVPDNVNPFFSEVARGIEDTGFEQGYSVILCNSDGNLDKELFYANVLAEKQVDGIVFVAAGMSVEHISSLQERCIPLVVIDREISGVAVDLVLTDNACGGKLATRHLLDLGHRRIGCITGPSELTPSADRITGYCQSLREAGISVDQALIVKGDFQYESGYRAALQLLAMDDPPTAIFACNDLMAVGAIHGAAERGRQVPVDLSVVGFDDVRLAAFTNPPLTTVVQSKYEMGELATRMLLERICGSKVPARRQLLNTYLLIRQSTAPVSVHKVQGERILARV